ncbi:MAG: hypothetical protein LBJ04_22770 [Sphingobacterium sp.]|jgi:hypothetical protein|nr:hypothetical protein [Sphingobacterium sp.]
MELNLTIIWVVLSILYLIQVVIVLRELNEGEYSKKMNVIIDLIPFSWIVFLLKEIIGFIYEITLENALYEFKKLK